MKANEYKVGRIFLGRLPNGGDFLAAVQEFCENQEITLGVFYCIGAVKRANLSFYDQKNRKYMSFEIDQELEISSCSGNVSLKDGKPMVHAHAVLANDAGKTYSGHLMAGTIIFAGEIYLQELVGEQLVRGYDETTGLPLWEMREP